MLDLEIVTPPTQTGLDIVSLVDMKRHLYVTNNYRDEQIKDAILDAAEALHGPGGELNRTLFPTTYRRYLHSFPSCPYIELPYPPFLELVSVSYDETETASPVSELDITKYTVLPDVSGLGRIALIPYQSWPVGLLAHPRAVSIVYRAGYTTYPRELKRAIKVYAANHLMNPEASITDRVQSQVSRKVEFGMEYSINRLRFPVSFAGWD